MAFSDVDYLDDYEDDYEEFCRECGIPVTWTSEEWVHDYNPEDDHYPVVPYDPYED